MKVLIIDDDKFARTVYESEFHQQNIIVELASDGGEGVEKAKKVLPDLIVMELILRKKNGFQVLQDFKNDKKLKEIPVVVCSSLGQKSDIDEAMELGASKYFFKEDFSLKQVVKEVIGMLS